MDFLDRIREYAPGTISSLPPGSLKPAAVLIAIHRRTHGVLFVQRSQTMRTHRGQIGFPGGGIEKGEEPFHAALREAAEEVALSPASVEFVGALDRMGTISDYLIHPFVALYEQGAGLEADGTETETFFEVPVSFFLSPENCRMEVWSKNHLEREMFFWDYEGRTIWGVTGRLLACFFEVAIGRPLQTELQPQPSRQEEFMRRFRQ